MRHPERRPSNNPETFQEAYANLVRRAVRVGHVSLAIMPGQPYFHFELDTAELNLPILFPESYGVATLTETHTVGLAVTPKTSRYYTEGWRAGVVFAPANRLRSSFGFSVAEQDKTLTLYRTHSEPAQSLDEVPFGNPFPSLAVPTQLPPKANLERPNLHYIASLITNEAYRDMMASQQEVQAFTRADA